MNITAKLIKKEAVVSGTSANGEWQKQILIFETSNEMYPKKICVTFWSKDVTDVVPTLKEGNSYSVSVNIESREYNGNWYTDIRAWKVDPVGGEAKPKQEPLLTKENNEGDDLPF